MSKKELKLAVIDGGLSMLEPNEDAHTALANLARAFGVQGSTPETCLNDLEELCLSKLKILAIQYPEYQKFLQRFRYVKLQISQQVNESIAETIFSTYFKDVIESFFISRIEIFNLLGSSKSIKQSKNYILGELLNVILQGEDSLLGRLRQA